MRIVLDAVGAVLYRGTGMGTYTHALATHLAALVPAAGAELHLLVPWGLPCQLPRSPGVVLHPVPRYLSGGRAQRALAGWLGRIAPDVFHQPRNGLGLPPEGWDREPALVVTVHDLIPFRRPEWCQQGYLYRFRAEVPRAVARARWVIVPTDFVRRDLLARLEVDPARVVVVPEAPEPVYRPLDREVIRRRLEAYGIRTPYFLYVGGYSPRKNVGRLLEAFLLAADSLPGEVNLVLAGRLDRPTARLLDAMPAGVLSRIARPGLVPTADLAAVYGGSLALVYASLEEGFGLPVLEAMACGTPVACAGTSALPEVAGAAARYFDPERPDDLARTMVELATRETLRRRLAAAGLARAARFSWEKAAARTLSLYRQAVQEPAPPLGSGGQRPG